MGECLLAVPAMGHPWSQRKRVQQTGAFFADCFVTAWTKELGWFATAEAGARDDPFQPGDVGGRELANTLNAVQTRMVRWVLASSAEEILRADERNRLVRWDEVARATLEWRRVTRASRLTLHLQTGEDWVLVTTGNQRAPQRFASIERALAMAGVAPRVEVLRRP